ncbi:hypothetical protein CL653_00345 [bacterium]|nr:hypothetical protein [bacterium]|tara:strand:- start:311 stop:2227 length:1917 start_codon:yes stop_codon:yes gene_type:complete
MSEIGKQEKLEDVKNRLYERGAKQTERIRQILPNEEKKVPSEWINPPSPKPQSTFVAKEDQQTNFETDMPKSRKKKYRIKILLAGLLFFVVALLVSSALLFLGNNVISGDNIDLSVSGPFTIGGGEEMLIQIGIQNSNRVPIESATLIVEYPRGTKSADEENRDLFIERTPLSKIDVGESISVPQSAIVYGEENTEQIIKVSIEYRVEGSNALFFKEVDALRYKISSAPVVAMVEAVDRVSVGQEATVIVKVASNSGETVRNILVRADYPNQWDFTAASPDTYAGNNVWLIDSLEPEEVYEIEVTGLVVGHVSEEANMLFEVGVPDSDDDTRIGSIFSSAEVVWEVESSFLEVSLDIDADSNGIKVVESEESVSGQIVLQNNSNDTVYDMEVTLNLGGSAFSDTSVYSTDGFFDSNTNSIVWGSASDSGLREFEPGDKARFSFSLLPNEAVTVTPEITLAVDVKAKRVSDSRVPESLRSEASGKIRVSGYPDILAEASHSSGPLPPRVGLETVYRISFMIDNRYNNLDDAVVVAVLPQNITWQDITGGVGNFSYNPSDRVVTWNAGDVRSGQRPIGTFDIALLPSSSNIGDTPILVREQRLKADDGFTGTVVRALNSFITAELSTETGEESGNGRVVE